jgi:low temperature requirement protein LtrA
MTPVATTDPRDAGSRIRRFTVPMTARDASEHHRVSTPLELLFDLTFVVAVGQAARGLAHEVEEMHLGTGVLGYLMVFFAIWWAWMNFSWFASAYDTDDVPYRLLTLLQMAGVLVLAAGVPSASQEQDFTGVVVGYLIMRVAMIGQWVRAGLSDPTHRRVALRYAGAIGVVQLGWVLRLFLPEGLSMAGFLVLVGLELAAPLWAERGFGTTWHPHHIAERYGLFTIIVLGEGVTAAMVAVQSSVEEGGWTADVVLVFTGGLALLFSLWWIYYLKPAGEGLARRPELSFWWGYGHYGIFASLAALGGGLEVAAAAISHHLEASDTVVAFAVAIPVAVFLLLVWALHAPLAGARPGDLPTVLVAIALTLAIAGLVGVGLPLSMAIFVLALPPAGIVLSAILTGRDPSLNQVA